MLCLLASSEFWEFLENPNFLKIIVLQTAGAQFDGDRIFGNGEKREIESTYGLGMRDRYPAGANSN